MTEQYTVQGLLNARFIAEQLNGVEGNQYVCSKCNKKCDGEQKFTICTEPKHLILYNKYFKFNVQNQELEKVYRKVSCDKFIEFPVVDENGASWVTRYSLYAVVVHSGIAATEGHYFTLGKNITGDWFKFNDSEVHRINFDEIDMVDGLETPYIYFYELITKVIEETEFDLKMGNQSTNEDDNCSEEYSEEECFEVQPLVVEQITLDELSPELKLIVEFQKALYSLEVEEHNKKLEQEKQKNGEQEQVKNKGGERAKVKNKGRESAKAKKNKENENIIHA